MTEYEPVGSKVFLTAKTAVLREGKILLIRRSKTAPSRPLGWDFPGGAAETNENPKTTVIRETLEETGIKLRDPRVIDTHFVYSEQLKSNVLVVFFQAETDDSEVKLSYEHDKYEWVSLDSISDFKIPEIFHTIISLIDTNTKN